MKRSREKPLQNEDAGIADVRRWRAKLWNQAGGTLTGVMRLLRESADARQATLKKPTSRRSA